MRLLAGGFADRTAVRGLRRAIVPLAASASRLRDLGAGRAAMAMPMVVADARVEAGEGAAQAAGASAAIRDVVSCI